MVYQYIPLHNGVPLHTVTHKRNTTSSLTPRRLLAPPGLAEDGRSLSDPLGRVPERLRRRRPPPAAGEDPRQRPVRAARQRRRTPSRASDAMPASAGARVPGHACRLPGRAGRCRGAARAAPGILPCDGGPRSREALSRNFRSRKFSRSEISRPPGRLGSVRAELRTRTAARSRRRRPCGLSHGAARLAGALQPAGMASKQAGR